MLFPSFATLPTPFRTHPFEHTTTRHACTTASAFDCSWPVALCPARFCVPFSLSHVGISVLCCRLLIFTYDFCSLGCCLLELCSLLYPLFRHIPCSLSVVTFSIHYCATCFYHCERVRLLLAYSYLPCAVLCPVLIFHLRCFCCTVAGYFLLNTFYLLGCISTKVRCLLHSLFRRILCSLSIATC